MCLRYIYRSGPLPCKKRLQDGWYIEVFTAQLTIFKYLHILQNKQTITKFLYYTFMSYNKVLFPCTSCIGDDFFEK
jgi:hypothetical protein